MKLNRKQLACYRKNGCLIVPKLFTLDKAMRLKYSNNDCNEVTRLLNVTYESNRNIQSAFALNKLYWTKHSSDNDLKYAESHKVIKEFVNKYGIVNKGGPTSTSVFHASSANGSSYEKDTATVTYYSICNTPKPSTRGRLDSVCSKDTWKLIPSGELQLIGNTNF